MLLETLPEFADRRGFAGAVDTDNQDHEGASPFDDERLRNRLQQLDQFGAQRLVKRDRIVQLFAFYPLRERIHDALRRFDADVGAQQTAFERFENLVVDGLLAEQQIADPARQRGTGLRESTAQAAKEPSLGVLVVLAHNRSL